MKILKKNKGIKILLTGLLISFGALSAMAQSAKRPDFSGTWLLYTAASQFNGIPLASAAATEISFEQHYTNIALAKLTKGPDGAPIYFRDTLGFDGKAS